MTTTQNLNLPQWEASDRIHHDDFNEAMERIDAAVTAAGNCHIYTGSYEGDGTSDRTIDLGFTPKLLIIFGYYEAVSRPALLFLTQSGARHIVNGTDTIGTDRTTLSGSQIIFTSRLYGNGTGTTNYYIAFV